MRVATFVGALLGIFSVVMAVAVFIYKLTHWDAYSVSMPSFAIGMFLIGAVILFFLGIMGEYILSINARSLRRPLVIVGKKINFTDNQIEENEVENDTENS